MYITIGRNPQSDIKIFGYDVVSYDHATIEYENGYYLFIDDSSNGTVVKGERINHESRQVRPGDSILLAGVCPLDWNLVLEKVNVSRENKGTVRMDNSRTTMLHGQQQSGNQQQNAYQQQQSYQQQQPYQQPGNGYYQNDGGYRQDNDSSVNENERRLFYEREIDGWNWGAFLLNWIWGVFNNVYWTLIALIPIPLCGLVVSIIAGIKGTRQAWENGNRKDSDIKVFKKKQKSWMIAGFIVMGVMLLLPILFWSALFGAIAIFD